MSRSSLWKTGILATLAFVAVWQLLTMAPSNTPPEPSPPLAVGDELPEVLTRPLGESTPVELLHDVLPDQCYYVYGFDPACPACNANAEVWSGITPPTASTSIPVIWMSLSVNDSTIAAYVADYDIRLPVRLPLEPLTISGFGLPAIPAAWGIEQDTIRILRRGASNVTPSHLAIDTSWCTVASGNSPTLQEF